jgi:hypothetical protein
MLIEDATQRTISWPQEFPKADFEGVSGAIDCASHFRFRVHPGQADYYRGDKHRHFLTAQVVTGLDGQIYNMQLGLGHNNDQGMLGLTGMKEFLFNNDIKLLADGGYSNLRLVVPDENRSSQWNHEQKNLRSVVETAIGYVKSWNAASDTFRQSPQHQILALNCIYHMAQRKLSRLPLRDGL